MRAHQFEPLQSKVSEKSSSVSVTALVTAGPRKSPDESFELGEDAAGVTNNGGLVGFWLADGTTSSTAFGILSTRLLAQDLGAVFLQLCSRLAPNNFETLVPRELCDEMCHIVQSRWQNRVEDFWNTLQPEHRKAIYLKLPHNTTGSRIVDWSVVFICGVIDSQSKSAIAIHCGDCFAHFFRSEGSHIDLSPRKGRLFLRLRITNIDSTPIVTFVPNEETFAVTEINNLTSFICMTDGIAKHSTLSRWLYENEVTQLNFIEHILATRAEMEDDRGVVYGTLLKPSDQLFDHIENDIDESDSGSAKKCSNSSSPQLDCTRQFPSASFDNDMEVPNE